MPGWELHEGLKAHANADFQSQGNTDLTIICKDDTFYAHKIIVGACSPFFAMMCNPKSPFKEARTGTVVLEDDDPLFVKLFLIYCYTGELDEEQFGDWICPGVKWEERIGVFYVFAYAIADKFRCDGLMRKAEDKFYNVMITNMSCEHMSWENEDAVIFARIAQKVYEVTPSTDRSLRDLVLYFTENITDGLMKSKRSKSILNGIDGFWADYFQYIALTKKRARKCPDCRVETTLSFPYWAFRSIDSDPDIRGAKCGSCGKWNSVLEWNMEIDADEVDDDDDDDEEDEEDEEDEDEGKRLETSTSGSNKRKRSEDAEIQPDTLAQPYKLRKRASSVP